MFFSNSFLVLLCGLCTLYLYTHFLFPSVTPLPKGFGFFHFALFGVLFPLFTLGFGWFTKWLWQDWHFHKKELKQL
jgi:hypothetical protein